MLTLPPVKTQIKTRFGESVFSKEGDIDRRALGAKVFGPENRQALHDLESIVHPEIRRQLGQLIESHRVAGEVQAIILDAAVMLEAGWDPLTSTIVFLDVPYEQRLERIQSRGWSESELKSRESSQLPLDEKRNRAHEVIDNSGDLEEAARQLERIIDKLIHAGE